MAQRLTEYFAFLSQNTVLQLVAIDEKWESAERYIKIQLKIFRKFQSVK